MTCARRCVSSSRPVAPASRRDRPGWGPPGAGEFRDCGAARSRPLPVSASSTTPASSGARSPAHHPASWKRSPGRCSSTTPNAPTSSTSPAPRMASRPRGARRRTPAKAASRPSLQWALEAISDGVAFVRDPHQNLLATNTLGRAFYSPVLGDGGRTPNLARFQFLDPASRDFYPDWDLFAEMCVGVMRAEAGRDPHDRGLQDLVGELSTRSETFRRLWADHDVRTHGTGTKRFRHPVVGELTLAYEELAITAEPGLVLLVYTAEPGSPSAERLGLLASWAASAETATPTSITHNDD